MTAPVINPAGQTLYEDVAALVETDEQYGWAALLLCSAIGALMQGNDQVVQDTDTHPGWTSILDPNVVIANWLVWLAWLYGVTLTPGASEVEQRATILALPPHQRGTRASLVAAAQQFLTGTRHVDFIERASSAYTLTVVTLTSETPDTGPVLAALLDQKPAGIVMTYVTSDSEVWDVASPVTWDTVGGTVTWDDMLTTTI